eukprot:m.149437 g.149437  ORF g.149437 m.149437 type:complete len:90 (+) comp23248_c0_seq4:120-389(+)
MAWPVSTREWGCFVATCRGDLVITLLRPPSCDWLTRHGIKLVLGESSPWMVLNQLIVQLVGMLEVFKKNILGSHVDPRQQLVTGRARVK